MSIRPFLPLLATVIVIAVNAAANIVPINGMNTGELSDLYPTGFTPPGYVFSIWSVIYLPLLAFGVAAWRGAPNLRARITEIQTPFLINAVGNAAWIFVWHYRLIAVSVPVMMVILATLIVMPLAYSITDGIGVGFLTYGILKVTSGKANDVKPLLWVSIAAFVIYFLVKLGIIAV